ncbi:hypothetical protein BJV77DRAFT_312480 [Russula vinacea]|nr:hypothetical protein BJV77DRAFT_312480 [Russula vinacea]
MGQVRNTIGVFASPDSPMRRPPDFKLVCPLRLDDNKYVQLQRWSWSAQGLKRRVHWTISLMRFVSPLFCFRSYSIPVVKHCYKITVNIPPERKDYECVRYEFDEATIYTTDGTPLQILLAVSVAIFPPIRAYVVQTFATEDPYNGMFGVTWNNIQPPELVSSPPLPLFRRKRDYEHALQEGH